MRGLILADTRSDGTYEVGGVPRGTVRVAVQLPPPRPRPRPDPDLRKARDGFALEQAKADDAAKMGRLSEPPPPPPPSGPLVPAQYSIPGTSGLVLELKEANQEYSIDLK